MLDVSKQDSRCTEIVRDRDRTLEERVLRHSFITVDWAETLKRYYLVVGCVTCGVLDHVELQETKVKVNSEIFRRKWKLTERVMYTHISFHHAHFSQPPAAGLLFVRSREDLDSRTRLLRVYGCEIQCNTSNKHVSSPPLLLLQWSPFCHQQEVTAHHWRGLVFQVASWENHFHIVMLISYFSHIFMIVKYWLLLTYFQTKRRESHHEHLWQSPGIIRFIIYLNICKQVNTFIKIIY